MPPPTLLSVTRPHHHQNRLRAAVPFNHPHRVLDRLNPAVAAADFASVGMFAHGRQLGMVGCADYHPPNRRHNAGQSPMFAGITS